MPSFRMVMLTFVLFASFFENTALKGPRSVQADLFDFVVPAWSDGTQADMDVSERILAELDAGYPCRHDDDVGERSIMNHFVVKFFSRIQVEPLEQLERLEPTVPRSLRLAFFYRFSYNPTHEGC